MKKLINLIALVMLVSTNVLTPLSYAQVETPEVIPENEMENAGESGETPEYMEDFLENVSNDLGELEQENQEDETSEDVDIQYDMENSTTDETEEPDTESNEVVQPVEEISENEIQDEEEKIEELEKVEESVVMSVIPDTTVTLLPGQEFNSIIKTLANGGAEVPYTGVDNNIQSFQRVDVEIAGVTTGEISVAGSEYPVHAWFSGGILYYATQAATIQLNEDSQSMFQGFSGLTGLDLSNFDTSDVTSMSNIFNGCSKLEDLNLSGWDFSKVMNMSQFGPIQSASQVKKLNMENTKFSGSMYGVFTSLDKLEEINLSGADVSRVTNMSYVFNGCRNLRELNLQGWDTSNVTTMNSMFYNCVNLRELDLSSFDTNRVTDMRYLVGLCSSLEKLNLDNWSFYGNPTISSMFFDTSSLKTLSARNWIIPETFNSAFGCTNALLCAENITIDVSNWDLSKAKNLKQLFFISYAKEIKGLDTWDTSSITNMNGMFQRSSITKLDLSNWNTSNVTDMSQMFYECRDLEEINVSAWNTSKVTNMYEMFRDCDKLEELDLRHFDVSNVTNMGEMFQDCNNLKILNLEGRDVGNMTRGNIGNIIHYCNNLEELNLSGWDFRNIGGERLFTSNLSSYQLSKVKKLNLTNTKFSGSMERAFSGIPNVEEIKFDGIDTNNVIDMHYMFQGCHNLTGLDLSSLNTSNVTVIYDMFDGCTELVNLNLSGWDFRKVGAQNLINKISLWSSPLKTLNMENAKFSGSMYNAFQGLSSKTGISLNLDNIDTSNVTNMAAMFQDCKGLTGLNISGWNTSNVTNMSQMFYGCSGLQNLDLSSLDTSKVSNMSTMFYGCSSLTGLDLSNWNTNSLTNMGAMFYGCSNLTGLNLSNWNTSNVNDMRSMFTNCNKLENLNLSGWDFRNISNSSLMDNLRNIYDSNNNYPSLKKLNLSNTKYTGDATYAFGGLDKIEEIKLDGADTSKVTNMSAMFNGDSKLTGLDLSSFDTSKVASMGAMFQNCSSLENLNLNNRNLLKNPVMDGFIANTPSLKYISMSGRIIPENFNDKISRNWAGGSSPIEEIDVSNWNLDQTKNIYGLFADSRSLKTIRGLDTWDTSGVTNMSTMFYNCSNLTGLDLSNFDTSNVTANNMQAMFNGCSKLENLNLDNWVITGNSNTIGGMFGGANNLKKVSMRNWTIPENFTNAIGCRASSLCVTGIENIDVSNWNLNGVKNLEGLFGDLKAKEIKGLDTWDTSNVTNMGAMFQNCYNLTGLNLSNWDTSNVTIMGGMFYNCTGLLNLNLNNWVITGNSNTIGGMFGGDNNLKTVSMRNWAIPETFIGAVGCRISQLCATGLESVDVSDWDLSNTKNLSGLFGDLKAKEIKGLNTWDTNGVTDMQNIFWGCSNITGFDLSNWNTSSVTNMGSMFAGCSKLENLDLSGWDFRNINNASLMSMMGLPSTLLKNLNMTNTKYTGNVTYAFGGLTKLEELKLEGADTSNVTDMNAMFNGDGKLKNLNLSSFNTSKVLNMSAMFYNCGNLTGLDLSNFDTSNVTSMGAMFYNTPNLKTIYASEKFVTTALSGDTSSKDMFSGTTSVVGGNGTVFDPNFIDKTYALIDKVGQTGYFTDKNAINVKFINTLDGTETLATFAKGQKLTPPFVDKYHVVGGYLDEAMTQQINLNNGVDSYSEIYVKYERNGSSGGGGGGGGGGSSSSNTGNTASQTGSQINSNTGSTTSGTNEKESETTTGSNAEIQTGSQVDPQNDMSSGATAKDPVTPVDSSANASEGQNNTQNGQSYSTEFQEAYEFAKGNGITTMPTIQSAQMNGKLTRIAMAKMLSQYAINVLGKEPDVSKGVVKFNDVTSKKDADYDNGVTLAYQLGIMGQNMPGNNFRPNDEVTRAEFATALSRMAYGTSDGEYKATSKYYIHHMEKLVKEGIITKDDPNMKELRGYVMIMLMRSAK